MQLAVNSQLQPTSKEQVEPSIKVNTSRPGQSNNSGGPVTINNNYNSNLIAIISNDQERQQSQTVKSTTTDPPLSECNGPQSSTKLHEDVTGVRVNHNSEVL